MAAVAGFNVHRGLLAVARRLARLQVRRDLLARAARSPLVVVEGVNDQENLGAIFRNAAAFGAGAVLLDPTCADPLYRRTVRVSLGHGAPGAFRPPGALAGGFAPGEKLWLCPVGAHPLTPRPRSIGAVAASSRAQVAWSSAQKATA